MPIASITPPHPEVWHWLPQSARHQCGYIHLRPTPGLFHQANAHTDAETRQNASSPRRSDISRGTIRHSVIGQEEAWSIADFPAHLPSLVLGGELLTRSLAC